ncbi:MAG: exonuclease subunit SbcD [Chlorobi bacterium]|nr:exonuclease subunit SbcD [Chlorobiota bacterium]
MKILHTADWHIGKRLGEFSRFEEQRKVLNEICEISDKENPDIIIIAGDLFDNKNPTSESIELLYTILKRLTNNGTKPVIAIAGNHDSPDRVDSADVLARECGIIFAGYPNCEIKLLDVSNGFSIIKSDKGFIEIKLPTSDIPIRVLLTPYANEQTLKTFLGQDNSEDELRLILKNHWKEIADKYCDNSGVNLLVAHLFFSKKGNDIELEDEDEKSILHVGGAQVIYSNDIPKQIQYSALGHLHRRISIEKNVVYSSSPIAYSFGETNQTKYVVLINAEPGDEVTIKDIPLVNGRKLLRSTFDNIDKAVEWLTENSEAIVEITIVSENSFSDEDGKRLRMAHKRIHCIIPQTSIYPNEVSLTRNIDLNKNIEELYRDYFEWKTNQKPNNQLMELFREVIATEITEDK